MTIDSSFIWQMEQVLDVYEKPYNPRFPVLCFDERPCQLIGDVLAPLPAKPGQERREDYHYKRNGTAVVLLAVEPLTGKRITKVTKRKTKKDYAEFMQEVESAYAEAEQITLVLDNLNTHNPSSFYETFTAAKAFKMTNRFKLVHTPKKASWLNMAEIDFSALSKQCLKRRIGAFHILTKEVSAWTKNRNCKKIKIEWQFTKSDARNKFKRSYSKIREIT